MQPPGNLFAVAAPSGAGKSSLVKALLELDSHLVVSISHTTRPPRGQEQDGREYHFVDEPTFRAMIAYKAARAGRRVIVIDRWHPSSKTCSACGHLLTELSLKVRRWQCPSCGTRHDRDINAAKNILAAGRAVAGNTPGHACGADVRHPGPPGCSRL